MTPGSPPPPMPTLSQLREVRLLSGFTDNELAYLQQQGETRAVQAHSNVIIEGELSWGVFFLLEGMVGVYKTNKLNQVNYDVGQLHAGSFFGELSLVDQNPRSATVKALTDCRLFVISRDRFERLVHHSPDLQLRFYEACIRVLAQRLRDLDDNYVISQYQLWKSALGERKAA
jgi:CRP-like cAMP-binding protein